MTILYIPTGAQVPDDWLKEVGMEGFQPKKDHYLPVPQKNMKIIPISFIEPKVREKGFDKGRMINILTGFRENSRIRPIKVDFQMTDKSYQYSLHSGYHRYYASAAVGYPKIPVVEYLI